jgi:hypothetical protein
MSRDGLNPLGLNKMGIFVSQPFTLYDENISERLVQHISVFFENCRSVINLSTGLSGVKRNKVQNYERKSVMTKFEFI